LSETVYLGLGSNQGFSKKTLIDACYKIRDLNGIFDMNCSHGYLTKPVSDLPQPYFLNMAISFKTTTPPKILFKQLEKIEWELGKVPKNKNEPRIIDIDLLYYGEYQFQSNELIIPHQEIKNRLFVLKPLADLTNTLPDIGDLQYYVDNFSNPNQETVEKIYEACAFTEF
jgi:2-amino-4-hydroxy-6-hydroxymethyldihydropteridine diphosphokinase